jgi:hypothetical protein
MFSYATGTMWAQLSAGTGVHPLVEGPLLEPIGFQSESRLLYRHHDRDGTGIGWLDLAELPVRERPLASRVVGDPLVVDGRWIVQIIDQRAQDGTGTLALLDVEAGHGWPLAEHVSRSYVTPLSSTAARGTLSVLYEVRRPVPSSADGLWLLRLRSDELP